MHERELLRFKSEQEEASKKAAKREKVLQSCQREVKRQQIALYILLDRLKQREAHVESRLATLDSATTFMANKCDEMAAFIGASERAQKALVEEAKR